MAAKAKMAPMIIQIWVGVKRRFSDRFFVFSMSLRDLRVSTHELILVFGP